jgi:hypothetical protein
MGHQGPASSLLTNDTFLLGMSMNRPRGPARQVRRCVRHTDQPAGLLPEHPWVSPLGVREVYTGDGKSLGEMTRCPWPLTLGRMISAFLPDFFHEQRGLTVKAATGLMFMFGMGCFMGSAAGGILGQWAYNRSRPGAALLMAGSTLLGIIPIYWLVNSPTPIGTPDGGFTPLAGFVALTGGVASFTGPLVRAFVMNGEAADVGNGRGFSTMTEHPAG